MFITFEDHSKKMKSTNIYVQLYCAVKQAKCTKLDVLVILTTNLEV